MAEEKNFENRVKKLLKDYGCYYIKYWGGGAFTRSGVPDLLICCNGFFLGVELKAAGGHPSKLQIVNLRKIEEAGGIGILLYPRMMDAFRDYITMLKFRPDHMASHMWDELFGWRKL